LRCTQSDVAARILKNWQIEKSKFLCVVPTAFRALLRKQRHEQEQPSVHFIAGDNLGVALEGGAYHG
ncbi:MAG: hypothetical protein NTX25_04500, partial [Proteobacteria bacterium]|nr:hypothetical protein [Pseudomonadota bacterium]